MTDRTISRRDLIVAGAAGAAGLTAAQLLSSIGIADAQMAKRYKIAIVPKSLDNPVFRLADAGGRMRASELGGIDFTYTGSAHADAAEQVAIVDGLISAGYDGIGISCCSAKALVKPIERAVRKGIKVTTWDSDSPKSKRAVCYGVDSFKAGQLQATLLNDLLKGKKGDVWILSGSPYAPNLEQRIAGFQKSIAGDYTIAGTSFCNDDPTLAASQIESVMRANPELIGLVLVGGWPLWTNPGSMPILRTKVRLGLQVVAFDSLEPELPFIVDGTVKAAVTQDYWGWGYQSVEILHGLLTGKKYPVFVRQALPVVTSANVSEYQQRWVASRTATGMAQAFNEAPVVAGIPPVERRHH